MLDPSDPDTPLKGLRIDPHRVSGERDRFVALKEMLVSFHRIPAAPLRIPPVNKTLSTVKP
jgi:hypothetical protein